MILSRRIPKQEVAGYKTPVGEPAAEPRTQVAVSAELVPLLLAVDLPQAGMLAEAEDAALYPAQGGAGHACRALFPAVGAAGCQAPSSTTTPPRLLVLVLVMQLLSHPCHASALYPWTTALRCPPPRSSACRWTSWPSRRRPRRRQGGCGPLDAAYACCRCVACLGILGCGFGRVPGRRQSRGGDGGGWKRYGMTTWEDIRTSAGLWAVGSRSLESTLSAGWQVKCSA